MVVVNRELLYDESEELESLYDIELNPGLTDEEIEDAMSIVRTIGVRGLLLVVGMPRSGKDLFVNVLCWKIKKYFRGRRILRDEMPRKLFGEYELFDEDVLFSDIAKMAKIAKGDIPREIKNGQSQLAKDTMTMVNQWRTTEGEVRLKNSVLYLSEFWRYMHNRRPMNPMGILIGGLVKTWGHLDMLLIGVAQQKIELDRFSCLPYVTQEARCMWMATKEDTAEIHIYRVRYVGSQGVLDAVDKHPTIIYVDGGQRREELGGKRFYDLYNSKSAIALNPRVRYSM